MYGIYNFKWQTRGRNLANVSTGTGEDIKKRLLETIQQPYFEALLL